MHFTGYQIVANHAITERGRAAARSLLFPEPMAARGRMSGRGPQAKRSGRDEQSKTAKGSGNSRLLAAGGRRAGGERGAGGAGGGRRAGGGGTGGAREERGRSGGGGGKKAREKQFVKKIVSLRRINSQEI